MAQEIKYVHPCNHSYTSVTPKYGSIDITRNIVSTQPDIFPANVEFVRIDRVVADSKIYYEEFDYQKSDSKVTLVWTQTKGPALGSKYTITGLYNEKEAHSYDPEHCERCSGIGWYASLVPPNNQTTKVTGLEKLTQSFMKFLYTDKSSAGGKYGVDFDKIIGTTVIDAQRIFADISDEIELCAEGFKLSQQQGVSEGSDITPSEMLGDVIIKDIAFIKERTSVMLSLIITNALGEYSEFNYVSP
ncbi:MAG: hypothetical protein RR420_00690 [Anaerovoracaceae bacterium]